MSSNPWLPFYVGDYLRDTSHLTAEEHGAYILLLFYYWTHRKPLKNDDERLRLIARTSYRVWKRIAATIKEFFIERDGFLHHKRMDAELMKLEVRLAKAKMGGEARAENIRKSKAEGIYKQPLQISLLV